MRNMQESGLACDAALARRRQTNKVPGYLHSGGMHFERGQAPALTGHSAAAKANQHYTCKPRSCLTCQAIPAHTPSIILMGPLAYNYFRLHPPSTAVPSTPVPRYPRRNTCGASLDCRKVSTANYLKFGPRPFLQNARRRLLHPGRLAAARLAMLGSRPRCPVMTFPHTRVPACPVWLVHERKFLTSTYSPHYVRGLWALTTIMGAANGLEWRTQPT